jgi:hypothetical protein
MGHASPTDVRVLSPQGHSMLDLNALVQNLMNQNHLLTQQIAQMTSNFQIQMNQMQAEFQRYHAQAMQHQADSLARQYQEALETERHQMTQNLYGVDPVPEKTPRRRWDDEDEPALPVIPPEDMVPFGPESLHDDPRSQPPEIIERRLRERLRLVQLGYPEDQIKAELFRQEEERLARRVLSQMNAAYEAKQLQEKAAAMESQVQARQAVRTAAQDKAILERMEKYYQQYPESRPAKPLTVDEILAIQIPDDVEKRHPLWFQSSDGNSESVSTDAPTPSTSPTKSQESGGRPKSPRRPSTKKKPKRKSRTKAKVKDSAKAPENVDALAEDRTHEKKPPSPSKKRR